ncbi:hypothetical protein IT411_00820 [Candidatus Peregrinibacteria bacterium]|nr:hypothetical protein [Candidatus Peregrinibacteria bacterium]
MNKSPEQSEQFEGELIVVLDREMGPADIVYTTAIDYSSGQKNDKAGGLLLELLALTEEVVTLSCNKRLSAENKRLLRHKKAELNFLLEIFSRQKLISKKILELLMEGKVKTGIWIDSIGGYTDTKEKLLCVADHLDRRQGKVSTYTDIKAASAAFDIAFLGHEINALKKSEFMWHFSDSDESPRTTKIAQFKAKGDLDEAGQQELEELMDILDQAKPGFKEKLWAEVLRQINHPDNQDGDVYFQGADLAEAGLITNCYKKGQELHAKFAADFPVYAETNSNFFTQSISEKVHRLIAGQMHWFDPRTLALTSKLQQKYERGSRSAKSKKKS